MAVTIKPRRTPTAGNIPTTANLVDGEMAINTTDKKIYMRVGAAIVEVANVSPVVASKGQLDGLGLLYVSSNSLTVTSGIAYIPSIGLPLEAPSNITKTGLSLVANTWYHVYLFLNGSSPDIEIVTTAPSSPYFGMARTKTGDTSRRYLGSIRTMPSSTSIMRFQHIVSSGSVLWSEVPASAPLRILSAGAATTSTSVSTSGCSPITASSLSMRVVNTTAIGGPIAFFGSPVDGSAVVAGTNYTISLESALEVYASIPIVSQTVKYLMNFASVGGGLFLDILGYQYDR